LLFLYLLTFLNNYNKINNTKKPFLFQMSPVKISVLMAVFNTPFDSIKRALDSVMNQDLRDFELLVVDDSSIDLGIQLISY